jgi:hypothetical protein
MSPVLSDTEMRARRTGMRAGDSVVMAGSSGWRGDRAGAAAASSARRWILGSAIVIDSQRL